MIAEHLGVTIMPELGLPSDTASSTRPQSMLRPGRRSAALRSLAIATPAIAERHAQRPRGEPPRDDANARRSASQPGRFG
jgi:hypothetical protein